MEPLSAAMEAVSFRLLSREQAAAVFSYLSKERQTKLLKATAGEDVANILMRCLMMTIPLCWMNCLPR
jgi:Mg/Co/Ni transporter MgtE